MGTSLIIMAILSISLLYNTLAWFFCDGYIGDLNILMIKDHGQLWTAPDGAAELISECDITK